MRLRHRQHGMAYLMVMIATALAAVLGLAVLSNASLQATTSSTSIRVTSAEYLAESGLQAACYMLQNPSATPASWTTANGYALHAVGVTIPGVAGSFDISAAGSGTRDAYNLMTTGRDLTSDSLCRSASAGITLVRAKPSFAAVLGTGNVINSRNTLTGAVLANANPSYSGSGTITGSLRTSVTPADFVIPTPATINYYGAGATANTYTMPDGTTTGVPDALNATLTAAPTANSSNVGRVFYRNGDLTITANTAITLAGTLVVKGNITVSGTGGLTITPSARMPALITSGTLKVSGMRCVVRANGIAYLGGGSGWVGTNTNSSILVSGCLILPDNATLAAATTGALSVTYNANLVDVPDISTTPQPVVSLSVLSWKQ